MMKLRFLYMLTLTILVVGTILSSLNYQPVAAAQSKSPDGIWEDINEKSIITFSTILPLERPSVRTLRLNLNSLKKRLQSLSSSPNKDNIITLPAPAGGGGNFIRFRIEESSVMEPSLAAQYPQIRTYRGQGVDDPTLTVRFTVTSDEFHALILSTEGAFQIDKFEDLVTALVPDRFKTMPERESVRDEKIIRQAIKRLGFDKLYVSYFKKDLPQEIKRLRCLVTTDDSTRATERDERNRRPSALSLLTTAQPRRVYRLAVAATAEYTATKDDQDPNNGSNVDDALRAIVDTINLVQAVYERDFNISFRLVSKEKDIIFTDAANDGYTNDDADSLLPENQTKLNAVIGNANYDVGHVFSTAGGGLAQIASVCVSTRKGMGETGLDDPSGKYFAIDYVAHELGHQFGANHTFNAVADNCTFNQTTGKGTRNPDTAFEPGSGSTIMSYAGICSPQNVETEVDDYFHAVSLAEIFKHINGTGNACPTKDTDADQPPTVDGGKDFIIPKETPFVLTAEGKDPDKDVLTFCWEQFTETGWDPSTAPPNDDSDGKTRPIFRSFRPVRRASRTFPNIAALLSKQIKFESLLTLKKNDSGKSVLSFRVTARDNRGRFAFDDVQVTVISKTDTDASVGPFVVTQPAAAISWKRGEAKTITWDVANTNLAPIACSKVKITLLIAGDEEHPVVLVESTDNNGTATVTMPNDAKLTDKARIKIEAVDNVFFNISPADIRIVSS